MNCNEWYLIRIDVHGCENVSEIRSCEPKVWAKCGIKTLAKYSDMMSVISFVSLK